MILVVDSKGLGVHGYFRRIYELKQQLQTLDERAKKFGSLNEDEVRKYRWREEEIVKNYQKIGELIYKEAEKIAEHPTNF